jgi:hypothetical protein
MISKKTLLKKAKKAGACKDEYRKARKADGAEYYTVLLYNIDWLINNGVLDKTDMIDVINSGADVHTGHDFALRWTSANGHTDVVKLLLEAGADVHARANEAFRWASRNGHTAIVKLLQQAMTE